MQIKCYLKTTDKDGKSIVFHSFSIKGKRYKLTSGLTVPVKDWNFQTQLLKKNTENAQEYNQTLRKQGREIETVYLQCLLEGSEFSKELAQRKLRPKAADLDGRDFFRHMQEWIGGHRLRGTRTDGTLRNYQDTFNRIGEFTTNKKFPVTFETIDRRFYEQFTGYILHEKDNYNINAGRHIKNLKAFMNEMTERGINRNLEFKKKYFKVFKDEPEIFALSMAEIKQMSRADLDQRLDKVRDLFLLEAYTGIRFGDIQNLRHEDPESDYISVPVIKTKDYLNLPLNRQAKSILKKYYDPEKKFVDLPKISNYRMNTFLKELCNLLGWTEGVRVVRFKGAIMYETRREKWELVSTHTARRSFVTNALELGIPPTLVMQLVGHKKMDIMKRYTRHNDKSLQEAISKFN